MKNPVGIILVSVLLAWILVRGTISLQPAQSESSKSSLATIIDRGSIRCSYLIYAPYFIKDPNTGKFSGFMYEIMEEIGKAAGLKIDWVEEVNFDNVFANLDARRSDVFCAGLWANAQRARAATFTQPLMYAVITAWGRTDETRFANLRELNSESVRISTIDGAMEDLIAQTEFSKAKRLSMVSSTPFSQNFENLVSGKSDATFVEPSVAILYLQRNPGTIKQLSGGKALRAFGNALVVKRGEVELAEFLNVAISELLQRGKIDEILARYEPAPGAFPRVALPYQPIELKLP
jgi:ABC-type amino acid transport substrate-binding protein